MVGVQVLGTYHLSWQAPTENVDGTPVAEIIEYRLHQGSSSRDYQEIVAVPGSQTEATATAEVGPIYVAITAVDIHGQESSFSNEVLMQAQ